MPVIKGSEVPEQRLAVSGCRMKIFPIQEMNDILNVLVVTRTPEEEDLWSMQMHSHPGFEEYWYILKGKATCRIGEDVVEVEEGDLVILPRGVKHHISGDVTFLNFVCKHNVFGMTYGTSMPYIAHAMPKREKPIAEMPKIGQHTEVDMTPLYKTAK